MDAGGAGGRLAGRRAIVTGAAQGIGRAIAARFAAEGARVALVDIDGGLARAAAATIPGAMAVPADIADAESVAAAVASAQAGLGGVDVLVNAAAARTPLSPITDLPLDHWHRALAVNLTGTFLMCRAVLPGMRAARSGVIVNIASQLGRVAVPGSAPYCATKGAVLQLTRTLALDHAAEGIRVVSLSPGAVLGERLQARYGDDASSEAALAHRHPVGRLGTPAEIAAAAVFLASDEASFMTGADLVVDGGYTAQ